MRLAEIKGYVERATYMAISPNQRWRYRKMPRRPVSQRSSRREPAGVSLVAQPLELSLSDGGKMR